ncbi:MAG: acyl-CoA thioesterase [Planctomycetota bacterium]|nr:MAG: acyl-CoA thioesterase [Planctomycetota bacterium]
MSSFETSIQVRFGHVDPAGIAYFPRIFDYLHDVFEEVWEQHVGQRYYHLLSERKIGFPLVHSDVDFRAPLRFGDRPTVRVTCFHLGRSALGLRYVIQLGESVCTEARMTTVCVELDDMRSIEMPAEFRARFELIKEAT